MITLSHVAPLPSVITRLAPPVRAYVADAGVPVLEEIRDAPRTDTGPPEPHDRGVDRAREALA